ncbi:MAG TPA: glutamate--cysteine ligase [Gammaproteobacteria bacterium]|nr:glutamate--cysteine ligase [Gammaproteobacteria bacterium]
MTGPLHLLEKQLLDKQHEIEEWFRDQWKKSPAPVYGSVDLRNSGFKLAPVDMNLFPAGFNNLNREFLPFSVEAAKIAITEVVPDAKKILLVPENHTRNFFYWENIRGLLNILESAGFEIKIGSLLPDYAEPTELDLPSGQKIILQTLSRNSDRIQVGNFIPDVVLLNNDLSDGIPEILQNLSLPIIPPAELGWNQRLKSEHFQYYSEIAREFAQLIDIDPWFIAPLFRHCGEIDFMLREGEECLAKNTEQLFAAIQEKYKQYDISCKPFVIVKADAGTYGMGVMTVRDVSEVKSLNRKQRTAMSKTKSGQPVRRVIVQEGVYTFETWGEGNSVAEPVVYMWGERVVGGFYRVHKERSIDENLNSPGMHFEPLAFLKTCHQPKKDSARDDCQNRFYAYGVIARLSMLAAAREVLEQKK